MTKTLITLTVGIFIGVMAALFLLPRSAASFSFSAESTSKEISWDEAQSMISMYLKDDHKTCIKFKPNGSDTVAILGAFRFDADQINNILNKNPTGQTPNELVVGLASAGTLTTGFWPFREYYPDLHLILMGSVTSAENPNGELLIPKDPGSSVGSGIYDHADPCPPYPVYYPPVP